jgi:hypothetical protein
MQLSGSHSETSMERDMTSHSRLLYRFRMRTYAETMFRRSRCEKQEMIWLQSSLMRLGSELRQSERWSSAASSSRLEPAR